MKSQLKTGMLIAIMSIFLSTVYLNCSGKTASPSGGGSDPSSNPTLTQGNPNSILDTTNTTTTDQTNNTLGNTNCTTGLITADCNTNSNTNTTTSNTNSVFDVLKNVYGDPSAFTVDLKVQFDYADLNKKGALFVFGQTTDNRLLVCTNPCNQNSAWKLWDANDSTTDWSATGLITLSGIQTALTGTFNISGLSGITISVGYGIGNTVDMAVKEMQNNLSYPQGRFKQVLSFP